MLNRAMLQGVFEDTPIVLDTNDGEGRICWWTMSVPRLRKGTPGQISDHFSCCAYNRTADFVVRNFAAGSRAVITGRMRTAVKTGKDGGAHTETQIVVDEIYFDGAREVQT